MADEQERCPKCGAEIFIGSWPFCGGTPESHGRSSASKTAMFPFTVNHVDGKPMVIESLHHLRQVEKTYGVAFSAFNKDNINDLDPMKDLPRYRGDDIDIRRGRR